jgi:hypothetical protein
MTSGLSSVKALSCPLRADSTVKCDVLIFMMSRPLSVGICGPEVPQAKEYKRPQNRGSEGSLRRKLVINTRECIVSPFLVLPARSALTRDRGVLSENRGTVSLRTYCR